MSANSFVRAPFSRNQLLSIRDCTASVDIWDGSIRAGKTQENALDTEMAADTKTKVQRPQKRLCDHVNSRDSPARAPRRGNPALATRTLRSRCSRGELVVRPLA